MAKSYHINLGEPPKLQPKRVAARWCAFLAIVAAIAAYNCTVGSYADPVRGAHGMDDFVMQNWGTALIFVEGFLLAALLWLQKGVYWFSWLLPKTVHLTDKQRMVRERMYSKAHTITALALLFLIPGTAMDIGEYGDAARKHIIMATIWILTLLFIALPSILAAWGKDS